jgi:phosphatidylserine decarboxylase
MYLFYYNRSKKKAEREQVYGAFFLKLLYPKNNFLWHLATPLRFIFGFFKCFSTLYGKMQKSPGSKKKIKPFIERFSIDSSEFEKKIDQFESFNDFFIRTLKKEARPITSAKAIIPADGRYQFFPQIDQNDLFLIKGKKLDLAKLLKSETLAQEYAQGSMVMARLCPIDYHRFFFPFDCTPNEPQLINGLLYSVNPKALMKAPSILWENKRMLTICNTTHFGKVLYLEIGATNVGSIHQTFSPHKAVKKGEEKGYFSFGGSMLILLFQKNTISFAPDLFDQTELEVYCQLGQPLI